MKKFTFLALFVAAGLSVGCGKNDVANHNKNLTPVTGKQSDLQGAGAAVSGQGSAQKATSPP